MCPSHELTHLDERGNAKMVDISGKEVTRRHATAEAVIEMNPATAQLVEQGEIGKGDVFAVARVAGIQAGKRTWDLIPLAHPIPVNTISVECAADTQQGIVRVSATATTTGQTGIEMEAMVACSIAALTVYDMVKGVDRDTIISRVRLLEKGGGSTGHWRADDSRQGGTA